MNDIREQQRITSLPTDLKDIANQMLEEKFGLAKKGEVVEKEKTQKKRPVEGEYGYAEHYRDNEGRMRPGYSPYADMNDYIRHLINMGGERYAHKAQGYNSPVDRLAHLMYEFTIRDGYFHQIIHTARYAGGGMFDFRLDHSREAYNPNRLDYSMQTRYFRMPAIHFEENPRRAAEQLYRAAREINRGY